MRQAPAGIRSAAQAVNSDHRHDPNRHSRAPDAKIATTTSNLMNLPNSGIYRANSTCHVNALNADYNASLIQLHKFHQNCHGSSNYKQCQPAEHENSRIPFCVTHPKTHSSPHYPDRPVHRQSIILISETVRNTNPQRHGRNPATTRKNDQMNEHLKDNVPPRTVPVRISCPSNTNSALSDPEGTSLTPQTDPSDLPHAAQPRNQLEQRPENVMEHPKDQLSSSDTENASLTDSLPALELSSTCSSIPKGKFWEASTPPESSANDHLPLLKDWATLKNLQIKIQSDRILQSDHKDILNKALFQTKINSQAHHKAST